MSTSIVWFQRDLRLADNPALSKALEKHEHVVAVYLHAPHQEAPWQPGEASQLWLHHSLASLAADLERCGNRLVIRNVPVTTDNCSMLKDIINETSATAVYWNRCYEPQAIARDKAIKSQLREHGVEVTTSKAALLFEPWEISTNQGNPYRVFTPFWKTLRHLDIPAPIPAPVEIPAPNCTVASETLHSLQLHPSKRWADNVEASWSIGEAGATAQLETFLGEELQHYATNRDVPSLNSTSRLSPHLHFGEISPRQLWHATKAYEVLRANQGTHISGEKFLSEIAWREFAYHLIYYYPDTQQEPMNEKFKHFPWRKDVEQGLAAWQQGLTGIPIVDAGMRELWHTGTMHNRVRMIAASFLTKNLLIHWKEGAAWFWDTLVDADLASNTLGWQWVAGSGADAAPYFRIFNPVLQGEKFDPDGEYVKHWVPELRQLPKKFIHSPWNASIEVLEAAGVTPGTEYPQPICDLKTSRQRALDAYSEIKQR